jgi:hypothetical protein
MSVPTSGTNPQQDVLDFSDLLISDRQRSEAMEVKRDSEQIQSINDRYETARRSTYENKMHSGVHTNKERRKLIEKLLRRPYCGRKVRSWRVENSDPVRGDIVPRGGRVSSNIMRSAKGNPDIDLHPGALGPLAGKSGMWLSDENIPGNMFDDYETLVAE